MTKHASDISTIAERPIDQTERGSLSRRRVVATGAWTIPAITVAVATPAAAASEQVDGCIRIVGNQQSRVDCNLRSAPSCVQLTAITGPIPVGTAITLEFDPKLIAVRFTDDKVDARTAAGTITAILKVAVPEHTSMNLHIEVTRAAVRGGSQRGYTGWRDTRGWGWGCDVTDLSASLEIRPRETNTTNNAASRRITVR
ncbi:hypothetical protein HQQ81_11255 [Microbacteriaceae bacterium VKM Ac-2854]|nr:hypothetical protein [Microbacteriaceae bacterium VKM Ac-2854]